MMIIVINPSVMKAPETGPEFSKYNFCFRKQGFIIRKWFIHMVTLKLKLVLKNAFTRWLVPHVRERLVVGSWQLAVNGWRLFSMTSTFCGQALTGNALSVTFIALKQNLHHEN